MRKQTKLVAVLSTAALLAVGASMTSFAATGWAEESGSWVYYDKNGDRVTDEWKKSGNNWFFLNDEGEMAVDELIEHEDNYYYVDASGSMVANKWISVENENAGDDDNEPDEWWYYFQANGKAYTSGSNSTTTSTKMINGKKYIFNDEGHMLYGWVNENYEMMNDDDGAFADAKYYCGDNNDGAAAVGWVQISVTDENASERLNKDDADDDQTYWFYFNTTGKKALDTTKTINGQKYYFDESGVMTSEWKTTSTTSTATTPIASYKYYSDPESGARVSKGWFQAIPDKTVNKAEYEDDSVFWYYAKSAGELARNEIKTINGKKFAFNNAGEMLNGLQALYYDADSKVLFNKKLDEDWKINRATKFDDDADILELKAVYADGESQTIEAKDAAIAAAADSRSWYGIYYFGDSDDGGAKTGTSNLTIDGESYTFLFKKDGETKGRGIEGISDKAVYQQGKKLKADKDNKYEAYYFAANDETGYEIVYLSHSDLIDGGYFNADGTIDNSKFDFYTGSKIDSTYRGKLLLVNTSGALIKTKSSAKDGDDWKFSVDNYAVTKYVSDES